MHSTLNQVYAHTVAADRVRAPVSASGLATASVARAVTASRRHRPPPVRGRAAYAAARVARRLDRDVARRAVA